jgi:hypothetical protein
MADHKPFNLQYWLIAAIVNYQFGLITLAKTYLPLATKLSDCDLSNMTALTK